MTILHWWPAIIVGAISAWVLGSTALYGWRNRWEILRSIIEDFPYFVGAVGIAFGIGLLAWLLAGA